MHGLLFFSGAQLSEGHLSPAVESSGWIQDRRQDRASSGQRLLYLCPLELAGSPRAAGIQAADSKGDRFAGFPQGLGYSPGKGLLYSDRNCPSGTQPQSLPWGAKATGSQEGI